MINFRYLIIRILSKIHTLILSNSYNFIGNKTVVYYRSRIINKVKGGITIGNRCLIGRTSYEYHAGMPFYTTLLNDGSNSYISIGNNCRLNGVYIHSQDYITIGNNCVMASGISIIDSNAHQVNSLNRLEGRDKAKGITIGNNVWIGLNAIILKDTIIGDNCVISARSIVKGNFAKNSIIQGNPAVIVGTVGFDNN